MDKYHQNNNISLDRFPKIEQIEQLYVRVPIKSYEPVPRKVFSFLDSGEYEYFLYQTSRKIIFLE